MNMETYIDRSYELISYAYSLTLDTLALVKHFATTAASCSSRLYIALTCFAYQITARAR